MVGVVPLIAMRPLLCGSLLLAALMALPPAAALEPEVNAPGTPTNSAVACADELGLCIFLGPCAGVKFSGAEVLVDRTGGGIYVEVGRGVGAFGGYSNYCDGALTT